MTTPRKPPVPAGERAFGFQAQVPCQGLLVSCDVNSVNFEALARDVRRSDRPARRRKLVLGDHFCNVDNTLQQLKEVAEREIAISPTGGEIDRVERPRRARARARAQAHQRLGTFSNRAVQRTAHGNTAAQSKPHDDLPQQASLYFGQRPSPRPRDVGEAAGAVTRGDIRLPQERSSEDRRKGGLTTEYNEFAELSRQTVEFLESDMTTVRETLYDVVYDDDGVNGDRDALGRITKKTEWIVQGDTPDPGGAARPLASRTYDYGYNPEGRPWLESVAVDGNVVSSYSYDDNGNRTAVDLSWSQLGYDSSFDVSLTEAETEYDSADRLLAYGSKSYTWNNFGQLESMTDSDPNGDGDTSDSEVTFYQYDLFGNLLRVDLPDGRAIEYDVDGAGRRVARRELDSAGNEISFRGWIYRDLLRPIAEVDSAGNVVARYVYADGKGSSLNGVSELLTRLGADRTAPYAHRGRNIPEQIQILNELGGVERTIALVANQTRGVEAAVDVDSGEILQRIEYDDFGRVVRDSSPGLQPFGFGGALYDHVTGLLRSGARDYDPDSARWTSRDPIRFEGGENTGAYVSNDPINQIDPTGTDACGMGGGIACGLVCAYFGGNFRCIFICAPVGDLSCEDYGDAWDTVRDAGKGRCVEGAEAQDYGIDSDGDGVVDQCNTDPDRHHPIRKSPSGCEHWTGTDY